MLERPVDPIRFHDSLAKNWELKYRKSSFQKRIKAFLSLLDVNDLDKQEWLDAGCGTGVLARALAAAGCRVTGVDASWAMIQAAGNLKSDRDHASVDDPVFQVIETIEKLDFPGSSFDGIVCSSVLEYVGDPNRAVSEFYRVLRPGGLLLVSVPNKVSLLRTIEKVSYAILMKCFGIGWPAYLAFSRHSYTSESFSRLLRDNSFTVLYSIRHSPYMPGFISRMGFSASIIIFLAKKQSL